MPQVEAVQPPEGQEMDTDLDESIESLMYDIDANEMARRARAAAKAPNEKTAELLSNTNKCTSAITKIIYDTDRFPFPFIYFRVRNLKTT
jgi:hypothetical protein